ncbi:hypothetical protein Tco_1148624 [Tanacetum coccineum]
MKMVASVNRGDGRGGDEVEMLAAVVVVMARMMMTAAVGSGEVETKVVVRLWKVAATNGRRGFRWWPEVGRSWWGGIGKSKEKGAKVISK